MNQPAIEGLREERQALRPIRKLADLILDTSRFTVHELRDYVRERYDARARRAACVVSVTVVRLQVRVPPEADLVFDVRFLPNPYFVPGLKRLTGMTRRCRASCGGKPERARSWSAAGASWTSCCRATSARARAI